MMEQKLVNKVFKEVHGKIIPESIKYYFNDEGKKKVHKLTFGYKAEGDESECQQIACDDKRFLTKLGQLYGFSYNKILKDFNEMKILSIQEEIQSHITDKPIVLLFKGKDCVNIVSERHKQLPMTKIHSMIMKVTKKMSVLNVETKETEEGYYQFRKGNKPWNDGKKGFDPSPKTHFKEGINVGEKNFTWKGGVQKPKNDCVHLWNGCNKRIRRPKSIYEKAFGKVPKGFVVYRTLGRL